VRLASWLEGAIAADMHRLLKEVELQPDVPWTMSTNG
jgi:hypothetical protein